MGDHPCFGTCGIRLYFDFPHQTLDGEDLFEAVAAQRLIHSLNRLNAGRKNKKVSARLQSIFSVWYRVLRLWDIQGDQIYISLVYALADVLLLYRHDIFEAGEAYVSPRKLDKIFSYLV